MVEKNQIIRAVTEALSSNGEGIVRHEGITFFVPYCLPGEKISFRVLKIKDKIGYGKAEEIFTPAEERVRPKCPVFTRCGGCQLQHLSYRCQLRFKGNVVKDALRKIAGIDIPVPAAVKSDLPYGYRNKLQLPVGVDKEGKNVIGFYAERSHRIVPLSGCPIHPDWAGSLIAALGRYMEECAVKGYDEETKKGSIRHIVVREIAGKFIVVLVSATEELPNLAHFESLLGEIFPVFTLWLNVNDKDTNVIFGEKFILKSGPGFFEGEECGVRYEAGPSTFVQVNAGVRAKLYEAVVRGIVPDGDEVVVDGYSGGGLLTAMLARACRRAYGIELEEEAVRCADSLREKNGIPNMINLCGRVEEKLSGALDKEKGEKLRLVLDPPRAGITRSVLKSVLESGIERIAIVSCNPATLARDLGILTGSLIEREGELVKNPAYAEAKAAAESAASAQTEGAGESRALLSDETESFSGNFGGLKGYYHIERIQPFDMFPQTRHVETLVMLERKNP